MNRINAEIWIFPQRPTVPIKTDQVYDIIKNYIKNGIVLPGSRIPAYRSVAALNKISRTTMCRIYKKLENDGWLDPIKGSGTFVSRSFPGHELEFPVDCNVERLPVRLSKPSLMKDQNDYPPADYIKIGFDTPSPHYMSQWLYQTKIAKHAKAYVNYNQMDRINAITNLEFKAAILDYLNKARRFRVGTECLSVVLGRTESLQQIFKVLLKPLDIVVNTSPRDQILRSVLNDYTAVSLDMSTSKSGFIEELKGLLKQNTIKALYIRPQCSHLECHSMSDSDCDELLALAKLHGFYIIEEDDYHEFWYEIKPFKPLICRNHKGHVIYSGALSLLTTYMQQTRTIVAAAEFMEMIQQTWMNQNPFKCASTEHAITWMLNNNILLSNIRKMQIEKKEHRFEASMQLVNAFGNVVDVVKPSAGLNFWLKFPDASSLRESISYLQNKNMNVPIHPHMGRPAFEERYVCLGFGTWDQMEVQEPAKLLFEKLNSIY